MNGEIYNFTRSYIKGGSLLDIGCGPKEYSNPFRGICHRIETVDAWAKLQPDHLIDLEKEGLERFKDEEFDNVLMIDFIEHLGKERGKFILEEAKRVCNNRICLLTPLWWTDNEENVNDPTLWCYGNEFDKHKSLWTLEDFAGWTRVELPSLKNYFFGYWQREEKKYNNFYV